MTITSTGILTTTGSITGNLNVSSSGSGNWLLYNNGAQWPQMTTYEVLGMKVEVGGSKNFELAISISLINRLGIEFYSDLIKQGIDFPTEISDILDKELSIYYRDSKINKILE